MKTTTSKSLPHPLIKISKLPKLSRKEETLIPPWTTTTVTTAPWTIMILKMISSLVKVITSSISTANATKAYKIIFKKPMVCFSTLLKNKLTKNQSNQWKKQVKIYKLYKTFNQRKRPLEKSQATNHNQSIRLKRKKKNHSQKIVQRIFILKTWIKQRINTVHIRHWTT